jgi:Transglycosylase SLT domain
VALYTVTRDEERHPPLALPSEIVGPDPLSYESGRTAAYERAAAFGLSHVLFAKSPGGVVAAASRTATFRPMVEDAVSGSGIDADLVEAIVFLESAGRPDVIAGDEPEHASGLTQILAETATNFLGMRVDLAASRELTRQIAEAQARGDESAVERLQQERRRMDERFDPAQALAGTVRYLREARREFGRDDLAVVSYHMGIGNLAGVARAYSGRASDPIADVVREDDLSYARVYFDSSPTDHREAWQELAAFGDDSQTYYWRVLAARDIMRLFREDPTRLERLAELHGRGRSAELVLHPPRAVRRFAAPDALEAALRLGRLEQVPDDPARLHFRVDPRLEATVRDLGGDPRAYRALRPRALRLLGYLAEEVYRLGREERPLTVTGAAYDEATGASLTPPDLAKEAHGSLHATGFAFDVRRRYGSGSQAAAFQWTLERLETLGLIAWTRGKNVIHVTVSPRADVSP